MSTLGKPKSTLWITTQEEYKTKAFEILNSYITYRKKYLIQNKNNYLTVKSTINDYFIKNHIIGKATYGIFVDKISKFLTFDIDIKANNINKSDVAKTQKWVLYKVVDVLEQEGLGQYLNISFSGSKGYHIDLVFNNPIRTEILKNYGEYIIKKYDLDNVLDYSNKRIAEVELRGCNNAGVKLPLGLNQKTKKYMGYLDDNYNIIKPNKDNFNNFELKVMDTEEFYILYSEVFEDIKELQFKKIQKNIIVKDKDNECTREKKELKYEKTELDYVVQNEILKNKGSRNDLIYLVALWCNSNKITRDMALKKLYNIIDNTPKELYQDITTKEFKYAECDRVIEKVYANNLVLFDEKDVKINKKILLWIMENCKTLKQMNIFLCHVYHCLKWGNSEGIYFLSQDRICEYSRTKKRDTVIKLNEELVKIGILEVVEKGKFIMLDEGIKKGIATTYKLAIPKEFLSNSKLKLNDKLDFIKLADKYLDKKDILAYIPKQTYYDNFKSKKSK
ncbi:MAG: hypothetical protein ACRCTZ_01240 [Sarcina sp.]